MLASTEEVLQSSRRSRERLKAFATLVGSNLQRVWLLWKKMVRNKACRLWLGRQPRFPTHPNN